MRRKGVINALTYTYNKTSIIINQEYYVIYVQGLLRRKLHTLHASSTWRLQGLVDVRDGGLWTLSVADYVEAQGSGMIGLESDEG